MVGFDVADESKAATDEFKVMGKDVAMQIAAMSPSYLDEASVPAEVIEHEKGILSAQLKEDPKMLTSRSRCWRRSLPVSWASSTRRTAW